MSSSETENCFHSGLTKASNFLAVSLHRLLAKEKENVFFSPFCISTAMAMLLCAAEGATERELSTALGYDHAGLRKEDLPLALQQQLSALQKRPDSYTLAYANCMLSQKGFEIKDEYKSILSESFKALILEVDFQNDTADVISKINEWVNEKTKNMIPKLIDSLDSTTVMVLLNAVYFKGNWFEKFDESSTCTQKFYNKGVVKNAKLVDTMYTIIPFPFTENKSFQAIQLPYEGKELAMLIILPRKINGLDSVEASLTPSFVHDIKNQLHEKKVEVSLPRFRLEYSKSLVSYFKRLGVKKVFCKGAELSVASDSKNLAVSEITHKAVLEVNEEGSEAAAAAMVGMVKCSSYVGPEFVADHPFVFVIYEIKSDLVLFMGRVNEL